jgi:hypothetical protein
MRPATSDIGDTDRVALHEIGALLGIGREVQIREENLPFAQHRALSRLRLLHFDDHLGCRKYRFGIRCDSRPSRPVCVVGRADTRARSRFDAHRMSVRDDLTYRRRREPDAILVILDLLWNAYMHFCLLYGTACQPCRCVNRQMFTTAANRSWYW